MVLQLCGTLAAQTLTPPDPDAIPVRLGPLLVDPRLALTDIGVDTNVFNEPDAAGPESDFTATIVPSADVWLPAGRTWLYGVLREDVVWFKEFVSERSLNSRLRGGWLVPLTRLSFNVGTGWTHTRERPGFEIDARADRDERELTGAAEVVTFSRTRFGVRGERRRFVYEEGQTFNGVDLRQELSRRNDVFAFTTRYELTPLTMLGASLSREQDRFLYNPLRDSDTGRIEAALELDPSALIGGTVRIGYRDFDPADPALAGYSGLTASANITYSALDAMRVSFQAGRDVEYSYDETQPYYLQSGFTASLRVQIYGPVDVDTRYGAQRLSYESRAAASTVDNRVDRFRTYGAGVGYHIGRNLRVGFNVDRQARTSELADRAYDGLRYGASLTYGR
jgi:hypothetical protein